MPNTDKIEKLIHREEKRLQTILKAADEYITDRQQQLRKYDDEMRELEEERREEMDWNRKQRLSNKIAEKRPYNPAKRLPPFEHRERPYLAVFSIDDDSIGKRTYALGKQSLFLRSEVVVVDWRKSAISQLYYEYNEGEEYYEVINGREREGVLTEKLQISVQSRDLLGITGADFDLSKKNGIWTDDKGLLSSSNRKIAAEDHRLVDIVALISREQFKEITKNSNGCLYLTGGAGSGKTTVALHRLSYLVFNEPKKFREERCLVVMFNRALKEYVKPSVLDLVGSKAKVETFSAWALNALKSLSHLTTPEIRPEDDIRGLDMAKRSSYLSPLLDTYFETTQPAVNVAVEVATFYASILNLWKKTDETKFMRLVPTELRKLCKTYQTVVENTKKSAKITYADLGLSVRILQARSPKKTVREALNWYDHIVIDEAQDLSQLELEALRYSTTKRRSLTLCADENQRILAHVDRYGLQNFRHSLTKNDDSDALEISYRSTKQIMQYSTRLKPANLKVKRSGAPVVEKTFKSEKTALTFLQKYVKKIEKDASSALTAVICRTKPEAKRLHDALQNVGLANLSSDLLSFDFKPGFVLTNAHQVKGLEFSNVILWNPSEENYKPSETNRNLLYVAVTRACDELTVIGIGEISPLLAKPKKTASKKTR